MSAVGEPIELAFVDGGGDRSIAVLSLDAPPLNLFTVAMRDRLVECLTAVSDVPGVGAAVLRSTSPSFSAGADLSEFGTAASVLDARRIRWDRDPWTLLWELQVPTVAAVRGYALGSGLEMAMLCDIRIASLDAQLGVPETKLGMLPAAGGTQSIARALGPARALPFVLMGEVIDATDSRALGLVHDVVDDPDARAMAIARRWAALPADLTAAACRLTRAASSLPLATGLALERRLATLIGSPSQLLEGTTH